MKIIKSNLAYQVYSLIKDNITAGAYLPGQVLLAKDLVEAFDVSPTPVREALLKLAQDNILEHADGRSFRIHDYSKDEFLRLSIARAQLETYAIDVIFDMHQQFDTQTLKSLFSEQEKSKKEKNYPHSLILNREFHKEYISWTNLSLINDFVENTCVISGPLLASLEHKDLGYDGINHPHQLFIDSLDNYDVALAKKIISDDVIKSAQRIYDFL